MSATDGRLFHQVPFHYRQGYPVDPRYATPGEQQLNQTTTEVMEKVMVTYGNGDFIARLLYEQQGLRYEDLEEVFYGQLKHTKKKTDKALPSLQVFQGRKLGVSGQYI